MEVDAGILEKLVCNGCGEYLSIGPVMLLKGEKSVCGRCSAPVRKKQTVLRNLPYELIAKKFLFPCQYKRYGCTTKQRFNRLKSHEAACDFRQYTCFLLETKSCNWLGVKTDILKHCKTKHPDLMVENPAIFTYDIVHKSVKNFLMVAFNILFLIHTKVCLETKKIYHCVRLFDDVENVKNYGYRLDICKETNMVCKYGKVSPQGCLYIKESDSVAVGINNLIELFEGYTGTIFKLTVISFVKEPQAGLKLRRKSLKRNSTKEMNCDNCKNLITYELAYYNKNKWICAECNTNKYDCQFKQKGCTFTNTHNKSLIHSWFYCNYRSTCNSCKVPIVDSINNHYDTAHNATTHSVGTVFTERLSRYMYKQLIITSAVGKLHCTHIFRDSKFQFYISSPIDNGELHFYAIELEFEGSATKYLAPIYNSNDFVCDWHIEIRQDEFMKFVTNDKFVLTLTITKVKSHLNTTKVRDMYIANKLSGNISL